MTRPVQKELFIYTLGIEAWENLLRSLHLGKLFDIVPLKHGGERLECWRVNKHNWEAFRNRVKSEEGKLPRYFFRYIDSGYIEELLPKSKRVQKPSSKHRTIKTLRRKMNHIPR